MKSFSLNSELDKNESKKKENSNDIIAKADDEGVEWSEENQTVGGRTKG